ncbi:unnamed protein product [Pieris macdunnoughi]|uniref:Cytochrome P450 n=1 Tax=Pieris macdunnoughi TaxID=345717 RepID=A0A821WVY8_9NEOP|nr:unnamed protein product [Pieris macdunnoughi]
MNQILKLGKKCLRFPKNYETNITTKNTTNKIPRAKSLPLIGTKIDLIKGGLGTRLHEFIDLRHQELGNIFMENFGTTDLLFVSDAELIRKLFINLEGKYPGHILPDPWLLYEKLYGQKRGLLFMDGEEWWQNRRIMNKLLLKDNANSWIQDSVTKTITIFIEHWKERSKHGIVINDVASELYNLSTKVIIQVLIGNTDPPQGKHYDELLTMFTESVKKIFETTTKLYGIPVNWCHRFNLKVWQDFKECVDLSLLLGNKLLKEILAVKNSSGLIKKLGDEKMDEITMSRIIIDFIIAAGDTTAYTSLWIFYLLSQNRNEITEIRSKKHTYIPFVIKEAMRLYPVAPFLTRILPEDSVVGEYSVKKGTPIIASIYTSGRNEQYFSKPEEFLPYRWDRSDERKGKLKNHIPFASLPFALGARSCVGRKIAMAQLTELIWQVVDNFDFRCMNGPSIKPITSQALIPNKNIELSLKVRNA